MSSHQSFDLVGAARQSLIEHGFQPDFPPQVIEELARFQAHRPMTQASVEDLRHLLWSSIDNETSRDLDQIEFAEELPGGMARVLIGIADVDAYVPKGSALDQYASVETVTLYAGVKNFPMLPEQLSTGLTSLLEGQDRTSVVTEFILDADGQENGNGHLPARIYRALVCNRAQLDYNSTGAWLSGTGKMPPKVAASA